MVEASTRIDTGPAQDIEILENTLHDIDPATNRQILAVYESGYQKYWLGMENLLKKTTSMQVLKRDGQIVGACTYNTNRMYSFCLDRRNQGQGLAQTLRDKAFEIVPDTWITISSEEYARQVVRLMVQSSKNPQVVTDLEEIIYLFSGITGVSPHDRFTMKFMRDRSLTRLLGMELIPVFAHTESVHGPNYWQIALRLPRLT